MNRRSISTRERVALFAAAGGLLDRFMAKVAPEPNSGCWLWTGAGKAAGYGHMWDGERYETAHRLSYRLFCGPIPEGSVVCHRCDVRCCVNPDHLWVGSVQENITDCIQKGRGRRGRFPGEAHNHAKLTNDDVAVIRNTRKYYGFARDLAVRFSVSPATISRVHKGETWRHLT